MTAILQGVRILEVAEHTFVPAASALLADYGAEVIKIEHVSRGDAMRGLASTGVAVLGDGVHALLEHSNRGKKSIALDLTTSEGLDILHRFVAISDVFLTNKLPGVRAKLNIGVDQIREHNPSIIYVRGTGQGERGPDADKGSYDALAFWARSGIAVGAHRPEYDITPCPPAPGFGDSLGAMTIAGGIMGALFHRANTGEATEVDVSLLATGMWGMGQSIALSLAMGAPWETPPEDRPNANPLSRNYTTSDGRVLAFTCLQAAKYWPLMCDAVGRPEFRNDERFATQPDILTNSEDAVAILKEVFSTATLADWRERLETFEGQWAVVQDPIEAAEDPQSVANGYIQDCETSTGVAFQLVAAPVQYDNQPAPTSRAPEFNEHGDELLEELGLDMEQIIDLKIRGVIV